MCEEEERQGSEEPLAEDRPGSESSMRVPGTGLGALAEALASNARKQQPPPAKEEPEGEPLAARAPGKPGSRKRKRGQPKQAVEPPAAAASGSGVPRCPACGLLCVIGKDGREGDGARECRTKWESG